MSWAEIKAALNSTLGASGFKPLDQQIDVVKTATAASTTASKTGTISQKEAYIISLLENTTYGLSALKNADKTVVLTTIVSAAVNLSVSVPAAFVCLGIMCRISTASSGPWTPAPIQAIGLTVAGVAITAKSLIVTNPSSVADMMTFTASKLHGAVLASMILYDGSSVGYSLSFSRGFPHYQKEAGTVYLAMANSTGYTEVNVFGYYI
jgi:hypothetical protein